MSVDGVPELDRVYTELKKGVANRIAKPGLMKAARMIAKRVKAAIPSRQKNLKKTIGVRSMKTKKNSGVAGVKVGVSVGSGRKTKGRDKTKGRKGVGISGRNAHWWFLGTEKRWTGTKRVGGHQAGRKNKRVATGRAIRYTGRMPAQVESVSVIASKSRGEIVRILRAAIAMGIEKEVVRMAKKQTI